MFKYAIALVLFGLAVCEDSPCKGHPSGFVADPKDDTKFFQCAHGQVAGQEQKCPVSDVTHEQLHFNEAQQMCLPKSSVDLPCPHPEIEGSHPYPYDKDKNQYIQCTCDNQKHCQTSLMKCPANLVFLEKCHACGYEDDQTCAASTANPPTGAPTSKPVTGTQATQPPVECKEKEVFPDPSDSKKYFKCVNGKKVSENCAAGTEFDKSVKQCI